MFGMITVCMALSIGQPAATTNTIVKETFGAGGKTRTYYLFVPQTATEDRPAPLLVLLHGSGRDGRTLMDPWAPFAKEQGIILAAPDAVNREGWNMREDGPAFLYALIEMLRVQHPVDPRRIYLFGHSAGAVHGLAMALLESEYFAAAGVHAGLLPQNVVPFIDRAPRKIPIAIWVGTNDHFFPLPAVRATRDALNSQGFAAELTEISGHTHWYYDRAPAINRKVWEFFQKHRLPDDPKYQQYDILK